MALIPPLMGSVTVLRASYSFVPRQVSDYLSVLSKKNYAYDVDLASSCPIVSHRLISEQQKHWVWDTVGSIKRGEQKDIDMGTNIFSRPPNCQPWWIQVTSVSTNLSFLLHIRLPDSPHIQERQMPVERVNTSLDAVLRSQDKNCYKKISR